MLFDVISVRGCRDTDVIRVWYRCDDIAISCEVLFTHSSDSVQLLCLYSSVENLALLVTYRQPDDKYHGHPSSANDFIFPLNRVKSLLTNLSPTPDIIFGGDFNLPHVTPGLKVFPQVSQRQRKDK